jgi:hypothetical protein
MADPMDPFSLNVLGVTDLVQNKTNKVNSESGESPEGAVSEKIDVLALDMEDEELLKLRNGWESKYASYETKHKQIVEKNKESYLGKKANGQWLAGDDNIAANLQFEAEETFLASALARNPEPVVFADNTPEGNAVSTAVKTMLAFHSDQLVVRRKLGVMVRQWSINHLGVLKPGWNEKLGDVALDNRRIQDFVFDPNGYVDAYGDFSSYLGERITVTAEKLVELYPDCKEYIEQQVENQMGTEVLYTEWWTDEYCFITFKDKVLDKFKNPLFKYAEPAIDELGEPVLDEFGQPVINEPCNHFAAPKKPYIFLSVFSLQEQPHDITGLIEQNIPNQRLITKRTEQIDYNASAANNSYAFSEDNFNQETAKQAATARRKGNPILVPSGGPIDAAIMPLPGQELPTSIFNGLENSKNDLRTSWGVQGITAEPQDEDQTARGMILNQAHDTSRIGGGIGNSIEQVADNAFNWLTQLYYVFYDEQHFAAVMGNAKAVEYVMLTNQDLDRQLVVSVAPDSLRPKDDITNINLAQALFDKGAIGPKTLLKMVDFPDPDEAAADGVLFRLDPMAYFQMNFPEYAQQLMQMQQEKAMMEMQNQAQGAGMTAAAEAGAAPEEITEPNEDIARDPASAALSQIQLPA